MSNHVLHSVSEQMVLLKHGSSNGNSHFVVCFFMAAYLPQDSCDTWKRDAKYINSWMNKNLLLTYELHAERQHDKCDVQGGILPLRALPFPIRIIPANKTSQKLCILSTAQHHSLLSGNSSQVAIESIATFLSYFLHLIELSCRCCVCCCNFFSYSRPCCRYCSLVVFSTWSSSAVSFKLIDGTFWFHHLIKGCQRRHLSYHFAMFVVTI